jgi:hypothetical protein
MESYSYRLPISVSFKKSSTAPVSLSSLNRSTTLIRAPRSLLRCPRFRLFPVILSTLFLRARHSRFHALHPPNKCPRVCFFFPESHHQQASDSFFFIRTRWVPMRAWPEASRYAGYRCPVVRATYRVLGSDSCFAQLFSFSDCAITIREGEKLSSCKLYDMTKEQLNTLRQILDENQKKNDRSDSTTADDTSGRRWKGRKERR